MNWGQYICCKCAYIRDLKIFMQNLHVVGVGIGPESCHRYDVDVSYSNARVQQSALAPDSAFCTYRSQVVGFLPSMRETWIAFPVLSLGPVPTMATVGIWGLSKQKEMYSLSLSVLIFIFLKKKSIK